MGFKDFFDKFKQKYIFVVDRETLRQFILEQIAFAKEHNLEEVEEIFIYINGVKKTINITNYAIDKGIAFKYEGLSYQDMNGFFEHVIDPIPGEYLKIELNWSNSKILNDFKNAHPELRPEDY